ncbi:MAG TPA: DUF4160 domain-containing protein [Bryobacteraceae bacterium]|jgi:hypothetical protein|nr:DUF4160 domain-containing protein [Bryobacteraceae bacterium]
MPYTEPLVPAAESAADDQFHMANLFPKHTGLPFVVWISERGNARHDIRVKVAPGPKALPEEMTSVGLRPDVHVIQGQLSSEHLAQLKRWIELNRQTLLQYWNSEIDTVDALAALQMI